METSSQKLSDILAGMWADALQVEAVAPDSDFFFLGGDSLSATTLMNEIENKWDCQVLLSAIYEQPIFSEFVDHLTDTYPQIRS